MTSIAVVSSIYGAYDAPAAPVEQTVECEYVLVTDTEVNCPPWKTIVEPRPQLHPRMAAKVAKCRPDLYTDADVIVWVDGSIVINSHDFVEWAVGHLDETAFKLAHVAPAMAQIPHPERQHIIHEAHASTAVPKYDGLPVHEQAAHYIERGYPDGWGLWATGLIVYTRAAAVAIGDRWLREQLRWTYQDQLSEAPILWAANIRPTDMSGPVFGHSRFHLRGHVSHL